MQRYFLPQTYAEVAPDFQLTGSDYHHAHNVMRMAVGDQCYLVCHDGVALVAEIQTVETGVLHLVELSREEQQKELPVQVTIACGFPKGDKLDWVVQKGTELGAEAFIGFPAQTSVVKWDQKKLAKRAERLTKIAKEAAEQSHRHVQPTVTLYERTGDFEQVLADYDHVLVAYEESAKAGEQSQLAQTLSGLQLGAKLLVLIGPEGGFSPAEISRYQELGAKLCGLGPRILRAETAPLYILGCISYQFELLA